MSTHSTIRGAIHAGWEPTNPNDLQEYRRCFDWEKPGDDAFLERLEAEAAAWVADNFSPTEDEDEDNCDECAAPLADSEGEGYDGLCGDCADKAEQEGRWL